jgi:hypothetical protein
MREAGTDHRDRAARPTIRHRMTTAASTTTQPRALSAKTWEALAVLGLVIAFSLSSTLVKRAAPPGSWSPSGG